MPDHSHDNISSTRANLAHASEGQLWDSMSPEERSRLLGQSIAGEADNSNIKNSVYQQGGGKAYETMPYTSLPANVQFAVSNLLHEGGYFQDSYGGNVYEVEGADRYECKDCEETFTAEEDFRVHRKVNHDDNGESETESQEAYLRSMEIDPDMTKDNLEWAKKVVRGESSRVSFPQNDPPTKSDVPLPKGKKEYDDNPNHYFYDTKLFRRGSRGGNYDQTGTALTEARALINLEEKILNKYGWESTKEIEKSLASRQVFATEVAKIVNVHNLHPRTIRILDSVHRPFLVNTLSKIAQETDAEDRGDIAPFIEEEPIIHQDYDPEHPHEHNAFDQNFGDKVAEEQEPELATPEDAERARLQMRDQIKDPYQEYEWQKGEEEEITPQEWDTADVPERKELLDIINDFVPQSDIDEPFEQLEPETKAEITEEEKGERTCPTCGFYSADEQELHSHVQDHVEPTHTELTGAFSEPAEEEHTGKHTEMADAIQRDNPDYSRDRAMKIANSQIHKYGLERKAEEDFPFEDQEEETTVTAEPDLLQNVNTDVLELEGEQYNPEEEVDEKAEEARIIQQYIGYKPKAGEAVGDILDGAIDVPLEKNTVEEDIYDRKLDGYHEDQIARELGINHEIEYEDAIERIRSIEVNDNDRTAKTLFGKKFADCNENEISEMKILGGEARKSSKGKKV